MVQPSLQVGDIVTAQLRRFQIEETVAQFESGLDDGKPGLLVADTAAVQATSLLEPRDGGFGGRAKDARLGTIRAEPGGTEAAL